MACLVAAFFEHLPRVVADRHALGRRGPAARPGLREVLERGDPAGSSVGVMITSWFVTKSVRSGHARFLRDRVHRGAAGRGEHVGGALATGSATRGRSDEPKLNVTVVPGFAASKSSPIWVNAFVSEEAANTVRRSILRTPLVVERSTMRTNTPTETTATANRTEP